MKPLLKTLHIIFACLWLGSATSIVVLQCLRGWSESYQQLAAMNEEFALLDFILIIPGALGSLLTGFLICRSTSWGFIRYRWIIAKWISTISAILVGTVLLGPWQMGMLQLSRQLEIMHDTAGAYDLIRLLFTLTGAIQVLMLIFIVAVSVRKPWGKRILKPKEYRIIKHSEAVI